MFLQKLGRVEDEDEEQDAGEDQQHCEKNDGKTKHKQTAIINFQLVGNYSSLFTGLHQNVSYVDCIYRISNSRLNPHSRPTRLKISYTLAPRNSSDFDTSQYASFQLYALHHQTLLYTQPT